MGLTTLLRFQTKLKKALGRDPDPVDLTDWVNSGLWEFAYAFKFPELQADGVVLTVQGTPNYALPADFRAFTDDGIQVVAPQERAYGILTAETRTNYQRSTRFVQTATQGWPQYYHKYEKKLWLRPIPDSRVTTLAFDYWKKAPPLALPTDVSLFDEDWDDIIFRGALYRGHLAYGEHDRMINVFNLFLSGIRSRVMAEDLEEFPEGGISLIQSEFDGNVR